MSLVTIVWSVVAAGALLLAIMHGLMWAMDRKARPSLAVVFLCLSIVSSVVVELGMMYSTTPEKWGEWVRWAQIPLFVRTVGLVAFLRLYFDTGRSWLIWTIVSARAIVLIAGFLTADPNFNFARIDSIDRIPFLGEQVTVVGRAVVSPHQWFASVSICLVLVFIVDASLTLWRRGTRDARRKVIVIGGAAFLSWTLAITVAQLVVFGIVHLPALFSPPDLIVLGAMTFELSRDTLRASRLAGELRESEARLQLAASAAGFGLWVWDVERRRIWATRAAREMFGLEEHEPIEVDRLWRLLHPDDIEAMRSVLGEATTSPDARELDFRILLSDGSVRWIAALGRSELDARGRVSLIRGVLRDVTEEFRTRQQVEELKRELAHAGRVSVLGTLSSSLAHELIQPLAGILANAQAARRRLAGTQPDLDEVQACLADIISDDKRAGEVIRRMRHLLKKTDFVVVPLELNNLAANTIRLVQNDALRNGVTIDFLPAPTLRVAYGDTVQIQQVILNLLTNAIAAAANGGAPTRKVTVWTSDSPVPYVELGVQDSGKGIAETDLERIFDPFFTTRRDGLGMGLTISRTIVEAHDGRLFAENDPAGGAIFRIHLRTEQSET
jgi:two-component system, LuxR family, sensor kinase FixL